jgi:hypothetical protein
MDSIIGSSGTLDSSAYYTHVTELRRFADAGHTKRNFSKRLPTLGAEIVDAFVEGVYNLYHNANVRTLTKGHKGWSQIRQHRKRALKLVRRRSNRLKIIKNLGPKYFAAVIAILELYATTTD